MQTGSKVAAISAAITLVGLLVGVIADSLDIVDFWQRHMNAPPGGAVPPTEKGAAAQGPPASPPSPPEEVVPAAPEGGGPRSQAPEPTPSKVESLINDRAASSGSVPRMALALDGDSADVELLETSLAGGLSSAEMRLVPGFFKPAFRERGFLRAAYDGDSDVLTRSGALAAVDQVLVGRVERTCRATGQLDSDLVTCDVQLGFKVFDRHGAIVNAGHLAVAGAGFSEDAARDRAVEMLVEQHGKRLISPE